MFYTRCYVALIIMRKILKYKRDFVGQKRIVKYFAIFPVTIGRDRRWFETVKIEQEFQSHFQGFEDGNSYSWENIRFID